MVALVFSGMGMVQSFRVNGGGDAARANVTVGSQSSLLLRALFGPGAFVDSASSSSSLSSRLFCFQAFIFLVNHDAYALEIFSGNSPWVVRK
jgi:hypothetical protein